MSAWVHRLAETSGLSELIRRYATDAEPDSRDRFGRLIYRVRHSPWFTPVLLLLSIVASGTGFYPLGPIILAATVLAPRRWLAVILATSIGALIGASSLALVIRILGGSPVDNYFPELRHGEIWQQSLVWINAYGSIALAALMASPLPQMPGMIVAALSDMGLPLIMLAVGIGKTAKYATYVLVIRWVMKEMAGREAVG